MTIRQTSALRAIRSGLAVMAHEVMVHASARMSRWHVCVGKHPRQRRIGAGSHQTVSGTAASIVTGIVTGIGTKISVRISVVRGL